MKLFQEKLEFNHHEMFEAMRKASIKKQQQFAESLKQCNSITRVEIGLMTYSFGRRSGSTEFCIEHINKPGFLVISHSNMARHSSFHPPKNVKCNLILVDELDDAFNQRYTGIKFQDIHTIVIDGSGYQNISQFKIMLFVNEALNHHIDKGWSDKKIETQPIAMVQVGG